MLCLVFLPWILVGQKVSIEQINESRSTQNSYFGNRCEVSLQVSGDVVRKYKFAKIAKVLKAVDDQGLDLLSDESNTSRYSELSGTQAYVSILLLPASRKAATIKELTGEVVLYDPTEANGGIVKVKNIGKSTNKNLASNVPGLSVMYLTKESLEKMATEQQKMKEAELKKQPKEMQELAKELERLIDAFTYMGMSGNEVTFYVKGDVGKLDNISFETPDGTYIGNNGWSATGDLVTYYFGEEIQSSFTVVLSVETPTSIKKVPFALKDIDLP